MITKHPLLHRTRLFITSALLTLFICQHSALASEKGAEHKQHHDVGVHGMALVMVGGKLIASHLPLHNSMHEHQIIFTTNISERPATSKQSQSQSQHQNKQHQLPQIVNSIEAALTKGQLITLLPEVFSLSKLRNSELTDFTATIYQGHFERGGKPIAKQVSFAIDQMLYQRKLSNKGVSNGEYNLINMGEGDVLAVHQIGDKPSFDHLVWLTSTSEKLVALPTSITTDGEKLSAQNKASLNLQSELGKSLEQHQSQLVFKQSLYFETQDFQ
ncbi:hypothetical protein [Thalassotalea euphylliae]|uniref:Uncharacterized protein n=1 Tax=Thalassotalea euphylliae TaxID=1655234 RepID=A0A3E0TZC5_9GAMM|nr:hypothetical protein [Thalassotalea euphylliae]REL29814.1 hypothetical protein DXX94_03315 [Thalassotalea euphylliae]